MLHSAVLEAFMGSEDLRWCVREVRFGINDQLRA